ncbi:type IV toxin-antitoxin system AbiEi family antitoxin domain-containing protein [Gordonia sp. SL306]|uniref:type IV toxin-antitoxin system AbiEi family antitoxin domain-containing protein n=1 Tax=Gordonia sp. SL306 TaxID=2995145 RepID=UPI00226E639A|nr:hypothetical protein [Gordonia sp. SL306]WAC56537.1 hypothetical protein OVA31_04575 [Gordonia sp. SL306]
MDEHGDTSSSDMFRRRDALIARGSDDRRLRQELDGGTLIKPWRGVYLPAPESSSADAAYLARVLAACEVAEIDKVVSHQSAAALHGLPLLHPDRSHVHFTVNRASGGHRRGQVLHPARLASADVVSVDGRTVTSLARTAADIARTGNMIQAVCVFDSALRAGATVDELRDVVARNRGRVGNTVARAALPHANPQSESIAESFSRALIVGFDDVPTPVVQHELFTPSGLFVARVDLYWEEDRMVGEVDGRAKYTADLEPGEQPGDRVWDEKRREDAIRDLDETVVRWGWQECMHPERLHALLRRGLDRARRRR